MRILWMKSDYILPPDTGGKIRTYQLLSELRRLCETTYVAFRPCETIEDLPREEFASRIITFHRNEERKRGLAFYLRVAAHMISPLPYIVQKYRSDLFKDAQREWYSMATEDGRGQSVILCDFLEMTENVDWSVPCPKVLFQHNVESMIWKRYRDHEEHLLKRAYFGFESRRMAAYEAAACNKFDLVLTVSEEDRKTLQHVLGVKTPVQVVETGVDVGYFSTAHVIEAIPGRLLFLGSLDWMPNIDAIRWFLAEVYPIIQRIHPQVSLDIVGRRPVPLVREMERQHTSVTLYPDVRDVRPHLGTATVVVVPLRIGGGSRIKIYEAMAASRAVVSTTVGAEGLPVRAGEHLGIADTAGAFASRVIELLEQQERRDQLAENALRFVTDRCQWRTIAKDMHDACAALLGDQAGGRPTTDPGPWLRSRTDR